jgi:hypothetical protein
MLLDDMLPKINKANPYVPSVYVREELLYSRSSRLFNHFTPIARLERSIAKADDSFAT